MKYILVIALIYGGYNWYTKYQLNSFEPVLGAEVVKIYGTNSCKYTRETLAFLDSKGIEYQYRDVKNSEIYAEMRLRMEQEGFKTNRYEIPTLDIGGNIFVDPSNEKIMREYQKSSI